MSVNLVVALVVILGMTFTTIAVHAGTTGNIGAMTRCIGHPKTYVAQVSDKFSTDIVNQTVTWLNKEWYIGATDLRSICLWSENVTMYAAIQSMWMDDRATQAAWVEVFPVEPETYELLYTLPNYFPPYMGRTVFQLNSTSVITWVSSPWPPTL